LVTVTGNNLLALGWIVPNSNGLGDNDAYELAASAELRDKQAANAAKTPAPSQVRILINDPRRQTHAIASFRAPMPLKYQLQARRRSKKRALKSVFT
jgi:hypothetical protein